MTSYPFPHLQLQMSDVLNTVKNFFALVSSTPSGDYETGERRFAVEDFDKRLCEMGVSLAEMGSRKWVSILDISGNRYVLITYSHGKGLYLSPFLGSDWMVLIINSSSLQAECSETYQHWARFSLLIKINHWKQGKINMRRVFWGGFFSLQPALLACDSGFFFWMQLFSWLFTVAARK